MIKFNTRTYLVFMILKVFIRCVGYNLEIQFIHPIQTNKNNTLLPLSLSLLPLQSLRYLLHVFLESDLLNYQESFENVLRNVKKETKNAASPEKFP